MKQQALGFVLCMSALALVGIRPSAEPIVPQNVSDTGCLGRQLQVCLNYLKGKLTIDESSWTFIESEVQEMDKLDVNGKRIGGTELPFSGGLPSLGENVAINIELTKNEIVRSISSSLVSDPNSATTEEDYDKTGLYEIASILLGSDCLTLDKLQFYRFFENVVKRQMKYEKDQTDFTDTSVRTTHGAHANNLPFCGKRFSYRSSFGVDTDLISEYNSDGTYQISSIYFQ